MEVTGILKRKSDAQQVSEKFKKRDFVLTDNSSQYPQHISFQLTQDKCELLDSISTGEELKVHFNLRGREWTNPKGEVQYFNTLEAWKIEKIGESTAPTSTSKPAATTSSKGGKTNTTSAPATQVSSNNFVSSNTPDDDLPF